MSQRYDRLGLILPAFILLVYAAAFIYGEFRPGTRWTLDSYEYAAAANNLVESGTFYAGDLDGARDPALYSRRTPLYPLILWLPLELAPDGAWVALLQIAMSLTAAGLLGAILRSVGVAGWPRRLAMAAFLLYPAQIIYSQSVMAEILLQFLLLLALYGLVRYRSSGSWRDAALMNLALALAPLAKPIAVFFWIPNLMFWGWLVLRERRRMALVLLALLPLLSVSLWSYRNLRVTGHYHFSSIVSRYVRYMTPRNERSRAEGRVFAETDRADWQAFWRSRIEDWPSTLWYYARGSGLFFVDPGRFDVYQFFGMKQDVSGIRIVRASPRERWDLLGQIDPLVLVYMVVLTLLNLLILAGFVIALFLPRIPWVVRVFAILVVSYITAAVGLAGFSRYRLAIEPYLLLGATVTAVWLLQKRATRPSATPGTQEPDPRLDASSTPGPQSG
ncbi:MAG: hypothetical protein WAO20_00240 [Acidobacteriota bacterium]